MNKRSVCLNGDYLLRLRKKSGFNRYEAADRIGISLNTLKKAEQGKPLFFATARQIAVFFNKSFEDICLKEQKAEIISPSLSLPASNKFSGHEYELMQIKQIINWGQAKATQALINIEGVSGIGKSTILNSSKKYSKSVSLISLGQRLNTDSSWDKCCNIWLDELKDYYGDETFDSNEVNSSKELLQYLFHKRSQLVICLDDIHLVGHDFISNLTKFIQDVRTQTLIVICTSSLEISKLRDRLANKHLHFSLTNIRLQPLKKSELQKISYQYPALEKQYRQQAVEESMGIPLLAIEQLEYLTNNQSPDKVFESIKHKLLRLTRHEKNILNLLVVANTYLADIEVLNLTYTELIHIENLLDKFLIKRTSQGRIQIFHPSIQRALYEKLHKDIKITLHELLGDYYMDRDNVRSSKHLQQASLFKNTNLSKDYSFSLTMNAATQCAETSLIQIKKALEKDLSYQEQAELYRLKAEVLEGLSND